MIDHASLEASRRWLAGSLSGRDEASLLHVAPYLGAGLVLALLLARPLTALSLGDDVARGLGHNVGLARAITALGVVLLCGSATALAGPIGFVGLVVPHAVRSLTGPDYRWILPFSAVLAPVLLLVSDIVGRVVLLPGVEMGEKTVMGSGALTRRNGYYADGTTWVGSKNGEALCLSQPDRNSTAATSATTSRTEQYYDLTKASPPIPNHSLNSSSTTLVKQTPIDSEQSSLYAVEEGHELKFFSNADLKDAERANAYRMSAMTRNVPEVEEPGMPPPPAAYDEQSASPFGRAFYQGQASYNVWGQFTIFCYATLITIAVAVYWNIGSIGAVQVLGHLVRRDDYATYILSMSTERPIVIYAMFCALIIAIMAAQSVFALAAIIAVKWILMGRRQQGNYDWDKSPYCQRWQLFLKFEAFRRTCYGGHGILGLLTGTAWVPMYFRCLGADIGKDCSLFSSGTPSLYFTEPDLLHLGNRVCVDDASLVGHINTRGKFDLNPLYVGDRSVLRSGSRLLSGARMECKRDKSKR